MSALIILACVIVWGPIEFKLWKHLNWPGSNGNYAVFAKSSRSCVIRPARRLAFVGVAAFALLLSGCEKYALDRQMEELCKKDGGVKVYETVVLPPELFDQWGDPFPGWRGRPLEDRLGPEYRYVVETSYLEQGDPLKGEGRLDRTVTQIYRRTDGKLLGQAISYGRSGGDFIAFAHPSSQSCPSVQNDEQWVIKSVFVKKVQ